MCDAQLQQGRRNHDNPASSRHRAEPGYPELRQRTASSELLAAPRATSRRLSMPHCSRPRSHREPHRVDPNPTVVVAPFTGAGDSTVGRHRRCL
ncbi:unnamed protein product [Urochloa humidicola]